MTQKKVVLKPKKVIVDSKGKPKDIVMSITDYRVILGTDTFAKRLFMRDYVMNPAFAQDNPNM